MASKRIAVAGPNGTLGPSTINVLTEQGFDITLLSRDATKTTAAFPGLKVLQVNYESVPELTQSLRHSETGANFDAIVVLLNREQLQAHIHLIDAAIAAGIKHMIPSSFGVDLRTGYNSTNPALANKKAMEEYLVRRAGEGALSFTAIHIGIIFDWALAHDILITLHDPSQPTRLFDHGHARFSATTLRDIGLAIANALHNPAQCADRFCFVHSAVLTQQQLLTYARAVAPQGRTFTTVDVDTQMMEQRALENQRNGDDSSMNRRAFILRGTFGLGAGVFEQTDNARLGIRELSEGDIKEMIRRELSPPTSS